MKINDLIFNCELSDIINKLRLQVDYFEKVKESGNNLMVQCPYHSNGKERRPSAGIHKETGQFHCFACGEVHSLPEVLSYCFGKDDGGIYGWQWLLKNYISIETEERNDVRLDLERNTNSRFSNNTISSNSNIADSSDVSIRNNKSDATRYVSEQELDSYRYIHPYMYERKLTDEIIEMFDVGYDAATEAITFPVKDINGNCLFVARRSVKLKWFNYPKNVEKQVYGIYELYQLPKFPDEVYICESMIDCLTLWTIGKYACALNGTGTQLQYKQLLEMPCRAFILATDNDEAGRKARKRLRKELYNKLIYEVVLPKNRKDINECTIDELNSLQIIL